MKIYQVDAFTDRAFSGNPAAVCLLTGPKDEVWMQAVAREMNLSETAFVRRSGEAFALRWFTPLVEVELCGHATLATAHILWETGLLPQREEAQFRTQSGGLTASREGNLIVLDFPARPPEESAAPHGLIEALGIAPRYVGRYEQFYLVEADSESEVRDIQPDFARMHELPVRGLMVTSRGSSADFDFVSRYFAPWAGVNEDPVTGSAHCCLGPFWSGRLGKDELVAYQASHRGGVVRVRIAGDRVQLGGRAVTVMAGALVNV